MDLWHELYRLLTETDKVLADLVSNYGAWVYAIVGAIVFAETGLVVTPFLPGDSLLFAAGAVFGAAGLDVWLLGLVIFASALAGDVVNYNVGRLIGERAFSGRFRWFKREHLERSHAFFEKYGGKAVILARFVPIVRTFMPFVAGIAKMPFRRFIIFSVLGAALWVTLLVGAGYWLGNIDFVKRHFEKVILLIVFVSVLPLFIAWIRARRAKRALATSQE